VNGNCQGGCEGVVCPHGQSCTAGFCIDLCRDVKCSGNQTCENGICLPSCVCRGCDTGQVCAENGKCVESGCEKSNCTAPAQFCMGGSCKDNCLGVICPGGQECSGGLCNPSVSTNMGTGGAVGTLKDAGGVDVPIFVGSGGKSGGPGPTTGSGGSSEMMGSISTCACETSSSGGPGTLLSTLILALLATLRARRSRG
jgi:MYXO-CTERM domain-containing protein